MERSKNIKNKLQEFITLNDTDFAALEDGC